MSDVVGTFGGGERREGSADGVPEGGPRPGRCGAQERLELSKDLFDGVVIGGIRGEEEQGRSHGFNRLTDRRAFVDGEIVQDDGVPRPQRWA